MKQILLLLFETLFGMISRVYSCTSLSASAGEENGPPTVISISTLFDTSYSSTSSVCYPDYGCFSSRFPFNDLPLPEDPLKMLPRYFLLELNRTNHIESRVIENATEIDAHRLILITHGFTGTYETSREWVDPLALGLYQHNPSIFVLFVEWAKGAAIRYKTSQTFKISNVYSQPASNTRTIAASVVKFLQSNPHFDISKAYCIGFSLGAHVCGFMAKYAESKWARLTAIDPAAPLFNKINSPEARVDKNDAIFLDAIHTSKMGLDFNVGHVDFYVNHVTLQPGCEKEFMPPGAPSWLMGEMMAYFACGHYRAPRLYAATINPPNPKCATTFRFCPCPENTFEDHECLWNSTQILGFGSHKYPDRQGAFCGHTTANPPYC